MLECPICRRSYDGRFRVFVPPHYEAFDTVVCARRAAEVWGWDKAAPIPVILPTIEAVGAPSEPPVASAARRRGIAALAALVVAPGQAALATGVGLLAAGTAASIYLSAQPPGKTAHSSAVAVGAPHIPQTIGPPPAATQPSATGSTHARPAKKAISRAKVVANRGTGRSLGRAPGRGGTAQLASQPAPLISISRVAETPGDSPPRAPKPPPSTSKSPKPPAPATPKPKPPSPPVNPPGPTEPPSGGGGGISTTDPVPQLASVTTTKPKKSKPGAPQPPPPAPPPEVTASEPPDSTRPGNGCGDENHDHTGPPGHEGEGNDHGPPGKGSDGSGRDGGGSGRGYGGGDESGHGGGDENGRGHGGGDESGRGYGGGDENGRGHGGGGDEHGHGH